MKEGSRGGKLHASSTRRREARLMLYVGLDLSRKRVDWQALDRDGARVGIGAVRSGRDGLVGLVQRLGDAEPVLAVIESMSGARFVHDQLELAGWDVRIADALRARGLAPFACKTDRIDCWVLAELARVNLVPEVWLPDAAVRAERERGTLAAAPGQAPSLAQKPGARDPLSAWAANPHRDLFGAGGRCPLARPAAARAVGDDGEGEPGVDRPARRANRRVRAGAAPARRRPRLDPAFDHAARHRLGARLHDRLRDRRHQPLSQPAQAGRLHRPHPQGRAAGGARPARAAPQERAQPPALGADRGRPHRRP
jgi:hypothetical protein